MKFSCPAWPLPRPEIDQAVRDAMKSGDWGHYQSAIHDVLRKQLGQMYGVDSVRLTCSGTASIEISLRAAGVGPGDEVIVAAFDYPGNFRSIELVGARPVLVDVDEVVFSISPSLLKAAESPSVKALLVSHLYGHFADVHEIRRFCDEQGWVLIEDACQVPGMKSGSCYAGSTGDLGTISFGGSKPLSSGCGGAVLTSQSRRIAKMSSLVDRPSDAFALSTLQAAVLVPQLDDLHQWNQRRDECARVIAAAAERFPTWMVHCNAAQGVAPAYYKLAFSATTGEQRARVVSSAERYGLPIGEGFRSMHHCSEKRCRKPVALDSAKRFGETVFVLDHRALLVNDNQRDELLDALEALHDKTV